MLRLRRTACSLPPDRTGEDGLIRMTAIPPRPPAGYGGYRRAIHAIALARGS